MNRHHKVIAGIFVAVAFAAIAALMYGCKPLEKVLNDPELYAQLRDSVFARGECVNDTLIEIKSDTVMYTDTLYSIDYVSDSVRVDSVIVVTNTKIKTVNKTITIHDTVKQIVKDEKQLDLLKKVMNRRKHVADSTIQAVTASKRYWKSKARKRSWLLYGLIAVNGVVLFRKPLWRLIRKLIFGVS